MFIRRMTITLCFAPSCWAVSKEQACDWMSYGWAWKSTFPRDFGVSLRSFARTCGDALCFLPPCHVRCALCHFCRWPLQQRRLSAVPPARRVIGPSLQSLPGAWSQSQLNGKRVCVRVCARLCVCVCVCVVRTCRRDKMTSENTCRRKLIGRGTTGKLKFPTS